MFELISLFLRSLSIIASDPALGSRGSTIKSVLDLAALAVERGAAGRDQLAALHEQLKHMVDEGREPTPEEWDALKARSDAAHRTIQEWKE